MIVDGLVSAIIPVHNRADLLREAVESALRQTYRPIEIIIIDDGSTDGTSTTINELIRAYPNEISAIRSANNGPGAAREAGRKLARGEFIQYLDSDDLLSPRKFEVQVNGLRRDRGCDVSYGKTRIYTIGARPADIPHRRTGERIDTMFPSFLRSRWWSTSTPLYRRAVIDRAGPWTNLRNEEDWEYDCRVAAQGIRLSYCSEFVSDRRLHDGQHLSANGSTDPSKLRHRAEAHRLIFAHAKSAGIGLHVSEMRHLARELFLLARQTGAAGLCDESHILFDLARQASEPQRAGAIDFVLYGLIARTLGWSTAGRISRQLDRLKA